MSPTTAVNAEYRHLVVGCSAVAAAAQPGQFFQLLCPHPAGEQPFLRRPMSLYGADPVKRQVEFLYKVTGAGTRGLDADQAGDELDIMGPLGAGFTLDPSWRTSSRSAAARGLRRSRRLQRPRRPTAPQVTAIFSARRPELMVSVDLFKGHGADVVPVTDSERPAGPAMSSAFCAA